MFSGEKLKVYVFFYVCALFRWTAGPKVNGVEPILVVFEEKKDKEQLWMKLSLKLRDDIIERRDSVFVTLFGYFFYLRGLIFASGC